jgi:hypothetical protein
MLPIAATPRTVARAAVSGLRLNMLFPPNFSMCGLSANAHFLLFLSAIFSQKAVENVEKISTYWLNLQKFNLDQM